MENTAGSISSKLGFKFITCLLASTIFACSATFLLQLLPTEIWSTLNYQLLMFVLLGIVLIVGTALAVLWDEQEKKAKSKATIWEAYLHAVIRYCLAFIISIYGFAKIFKTQFTTADFVKDMPLGEVNGFYLTWYYFGYSYTLAIIIAIFQIGGAILLLFRRSTLMGTMVLLPVMMNIVFINMFYSIAVGAFIVSILITLGLLYLLLLDFQKLKEVFWVVTDQMPSINPGRSWLKPLIRSLPVLAAFGIIYRFVLQDTSDKQLVGVWRVEKFMRNGALLADDAWMRDSTVIAKVYFSGAYGCAFSSNPFVYNPKQSLQGQYTFDQKQGMLQFISYNGRPYTSKVRISGLTSHRMNIDGILKNDTLRMELVKVNRLK